MAGFTDRIGAALVTWARIQLKFPRATIGVFVLLTAAALAYAGSTLGVNTDTTTMIDASLPWRQHFIDYRTTFPARDRNLIVVVDAAMSSQADAFAEELARELGNRPELYRSVLLPGSGEFFERAGLLYLSVPELETLSNRLAAAQPLIGLLGERIDGARVVDVAARAADAAQGASADDAALAAFDAELAAVLGAAERGERRALAWRALLGAGDASDTRRTIVLQPLLEFGRLQPASAAMAGIREIAASLAADDAAPPTVRITGSVAMEHEELISVNRGASFAGLLTLVLVAAVLYAAFRSWRLLGVTLATLVASLALTAAFAAAAVGHLNLISIAFVVLNVGLGGDYVIHVTLRHRELCARGLSPRDAALETMRDVGASLVLCAITTSTGFFAFVPTAFEGVSELGLIAGTGVILSMLTSVTLLPALLVVVARAQRGPPPRAWLTARPLAKLSARPMPVLVAAALLAIAALAALPAARFDSNPINLRDPQSESVATLNELAAAGDAPLYALAAIAPDTATAELWAGQLAALPEVRSATTIAALVPRSQDDKIAILEDTALLMGTGFGELEQAPADPAALMRALGALANDVSGAAAGGAPAAAGNVTATATATAARAAARSLLQALERATPAERERTLRALDDDLAAGLPRELRRLERGLAAEPFGRAALPEPLRERWVGAGGRELVEIAPAGDVSDNAAAARFVAAVRSVVPTATGLPVVYREASATVVGAFQQALGFALLMIVVIVFLFLRSVRDTLLVVVPIVLAAAVTGAATVLFDMPFNYANIITLPLLVGIGVDNGIYVVHRLRSATSTAALFETSTMDAVLASSLMTVASFGTLAFSAHVGTASMGKLLALGLSAIMLMTLVVLPAWLTWRARRAGAQPAAAGESQR